MIVAILKNDLLNNVKNAEVCDHAPRASEGATQQVVTVALPLVHNYFFKTTLKVVPFPGSEDFTKISPL